MSGSEAQNYADNNGFTFVANDPSSPSGKCGANLSWQLSSDGVLTVSGNGAMNDFNNSSAAPWAKYSTKTDGFLITSVVITEGVTSVGANAFSNCRELSSISLPAGLLKIGASAFENCSGVSSAIIPESTSSIASKAFSACTALSEITIGSSVKSIGDEAFMLTGIKELNLSSSVTSIGKQAFYGCQDLLSCQNPGSNEYCREGVCGMCFTAFCIRWNFTHRDRRFLLLRGVLCFRISLFPQGSAVSQKELFIPARH